MEPFGILGTFQPSVLNNSADMAGYCGGQGEACVIREGRLSVLPHPVCGSECGVSIGGINARGDVTGTFAEQGAQDRALVWPREGGWNWIALDRSDDILNDGTIIGGASAQPAILSRNGEVITAPTSQASGAAFTANHSGLVVGNGGNFDQAFAWDSRNGSFLLLGEPGSNAADVNERGDVIGTVGINTLEPNAVIWHVR